MNFSINREDTTWRQKQTNGRWIPCPVLFLYPTPWPDPCGCPPATLLTGVGWDRSWLWGSTLSTVPAPRKPLVFTAPWQLLVVLHVIPDHYGHHANFISKLDIYKLFASFVTSWACRITTNIVSLVPWSWFKNLWKQIKEHFFGIHSGFNCLPIPSLFCNEKGWCCIWKLILSWSMSRVQLPWFWQKEEWNITKLKSRTIRISHTTFFTLISDPLLNSVSPT